MSALVSDALLPAWEDSVHASQAVFRSTLKALAEPGLVQRLPITVNGPAPLAPATTALCLALADFETPIWLDQGARTAEVMAYLRFHCGCALPTTAATAAFALITDTAELVLDRFPQGSPEYPDRSATLFMQVPTLTAGPERTWRGPGIAESRRVCIGGLPDDFDRQWHANVARFPLGVDIVFCCGDDIVGLPRTTHILSEETPCT